MQGLPRLLAIGSDSGDVDLLTSSLGAHFEVIVGGSVTQALGRVAKERFDIVLVDVSGTGGDGAEVLAKVRAASPASRRVLVSAIGERAPAVLRAIERGDVHRVIRKPVTLDALRDVGATLRRDTLPGLRRVLVVDADRARGEGVGRLLSASGEFIALHVEAIEGTENAAIVLLVEPRDPGRVEELLTVLASRGEKRPAVFAALGVSEDGAAAPLGLAGVDEIVWLPLRADEVSLRYRLWRERRAALEETERIRAEALAGQPMAEILGRSRAMQRVFAVIHRVARTDSTVLVLGETGTGKELLARGVHALSHRREGHFVAVNLAAVPETLVESELFGHERGAFTGAVSSRAGRIEEAEGGTLFLDEIGDLSTSVQVKLLRVLQERRYERVGATKGRDADFRLICATHRPLDELVAEGKFRADLYYRINVVRVDVPALRERDEDVALLAAYFLDRFARRAKKALQLSPELDRAMRAHGWPGNVRELEHFIERAVAIARDGDVLGPELLEARPSRRSFSSDVAGFFESGRGLREVLDDIERAILVDTLQRYGGNQVAAAAKLKLPRQTLQHRLRRYGL